MEALLEKLKTDYPQLKLVAGKSFCWSPASKQISYKLREQSPQGAWSLLHEVGHALLQHKAYTLDFELLELEVIAWQKAKLLAAQYGLTIEGDHIENCLDTYRDWLYRRSICPNCETVCLQCDASQHYRCFNCHTTWRVAASRFCRPYRQAKGHSSAAPLLLERESTVSYPA